MELQRDNLGRFVVNQLIFAKDTAPMADSEYKLYILVHEFGRMCNRRNSRANVGKSKVMWCYRGM